jgi:hypothetical protein
MRTSLLLLLGGCLSVATAADSHGNEWNSDEVFSHGVQLRAVGQVLMDGEFTIASNDETWDEGWRAQLEILPAPIAGVAGIEPFGGLYLAYDSRTWDGVTSAQPMPLMVHTTGPTLPSLLSGNIERQWYGGGLHGGAAFHLLRQHNGLGLALAPRLQAGVGLQDGDWRFQAGALPSSGSLDGTIFEAGGSLDVLARFGRAELGVGLGANWWLGQESTAISAGGNGLIYATSLETGGRDFPARVFGGWRF